MESRTYKEGIGSGIVFHVSNKDVMIVTNYHVVANNNMLTVTFLGNYSVPATVVGLDAQTDLAVKGITGGSSSKLKEK